MSSQYISSPELKAIPLYLPPKSLVPYSFSPLEFETPVFDDNSSLDTPQIDSLFLNGLQCFSSQNSVLPFQSQTLPPPIIELDSYSFPTVTNSSPATLLKSSLQHTHLDLPSLTYYEVPQPRQADPPLPLSHPLSISRLFSNRMLFLPMIYQCTHSVDTSYDASTSSHPGYLPLSDIDSDYLQVPTLSNTIRPTIKMCLFPIFAKQSSLLPSSNVSNHISDSLLLEAIPDASHTTPSISSFVDTWTREG